MILELRKLEQSNDFSESEIKAISDEEENRGHTCINWYALFLKSHLRLSDFSEAAAREYNITWRKVYNRVRAGKELSQKKGISIEELLQNPKYNGVRA